MTTRINWRLYKFGVLSGGKNSIYFFGEKCVLWLIEKDFSFFLIFWGLLTWPNEDDRMNTTKICEHDWKLTKTNLNMVNMTVVFFYFFVCALFIINFRLDTFCSYSCKGASGKKCQKTPLEGYSPVNVLCCGNIYDIFNFRSNSIIFGRV